MFYIIVVVGSSSSDVQYREREREREDREMGVIKQIWIKDESLLILQKMMQDGITLSDWVNEKIQEYNTKKTGALTIEEAEKKLREYTDPIEEDVWQTFKKAKPSLASRLKNMGKEELETVINDDKNDEITKSFARVFLNRLGGDERK